MADELCGKRCRAEANHGEADCNQQGRPKLLAYSHPHEGQQVACGLSFEPRPERASGHSIRCAARHRIATVEFNHTWVRLPISATSVGNADAFGPFATMIGIAL